MRRAFSFLLVGMLSWSVSAQDAEANGWVREQRHRAEHFRSSLPRANAMLDRSPREVVVNFSKPVTQARSVLIVYDDFDRQVSYRRVMHRDGGRTLVTQVPPLPSGRYLVHWEAECSCETDLVMADSFSFTIR